MKTTASTVPMTDYVGFYMRDHLGNNRMVIDADGGVRQIQHYYPFGLSFEVRNFGPASAANHRGFGGKEFDRVSGLDLYDFEARQYDPATLRMQRQDDYSEKYHPHTSYHYCLNNPMIFVDPSGQSTWVTCSGDGKYTVVGGNLNDGDLNIYVITKDENGDFVKGESIGVTTSITSFYDSDTNDWIEGSINLKDTSGSEFLENIFSNTPTLDEYIPNGTHHGKYDFKALPNGNDDQRYHYRGISIGKNSKGQNIITSARDIGNIAAGYVAGANGLSWAEARLGFDYYQYRTNGKIEGKSTRNAQLLGYKAGIQNSGVEKLLRKSYAFIRLFFITF